MDKILFLDDEKERYIKLMSKKTMFASRLHVGDLDIKWVSTVADFLKEDLLQYSMIMFDHDMPDMEGAGMVAVEHTIKVFSELEAPAEMKPICWVHSMNLDPAERMADKLAAAGFKVFQQSFPMLISKM